MSKDEPKMTTNVVAQKSQIDSVDETQIAVTQGMSDLQRALFEHASRQKVRLERQDAIIEKVEERLYNPEIMDNMSPKDLVKLMSVVLGSQEATVAFLQGLYKSTLQASDVLKLTRTLSISDDGDTEIVDSAKMKIDPARQGALMKLLEENLIKKSNGGNVL